MEEVDDKNEWRWSCRRDYCSRSWKKTTRGLRRQPPPLSIPSYGHCQPSIAPLSVSTKSNGAQALPRPASSCTRDRHMPLQQRKLPPASPEQEAARLRGGDGRPAGRPWRARPLPGGDREPVWGEGAGQRRHAPPDPHPHPLRALPREPAAAARRGAALPRRRAQAPLQGRRLEAGPLRRRRRRAAARAAAVRLEGARRALRPGAHRQDQRRARRRRPRPGGPGVRGTQPGDGRALHALCRRRQPHRQRLHRRRQDR